VHGHKSIPYSSSYLHVVHTKKHTHTKLRRLGTFQKAMLSMKPRRNGYKITFTLLYLQRVNATIRPVIRIQGETIPYLEVAASFIGYFLGSLVVVSMRTNFGFSECKIRK